ncbi:ammonium transporter [Salinisphaera hydrothermalis]|uniref:Ammonium transporter n=1 Tax=Salinisphaera hydrothermalis (strain C41B8) TaxID=1304275 RepID=A0A084IL52_SALHC|nr:ammonium transporter [Salinisphaera hydrothermalis]KEZ77436.1 ammonium transporter [Salinisphaera hydrothermalis C41B8]
MSLISIRRRASALFLCIGLGVSPTVWAAPATATFDKADTAWMMMATALVLFMTLPGLALFYGGLVRVRNVLSVLMQCFAICALSSLLWFFIGYSLAFSGHGWFIGNLDRIGLAGITPNDVTGTIPSFLFVLYQMTFAVITPALIIGGFAERLRFSALLWFSALWLLIVYIPVVHWIWGGGWLGQLGMLDFAGGTVVHITAGVAALVAAIVLGPRNGFQKRPMAPHNLTMTVSGAGMLWVGWFGFNGGSALAVDGQAVSAMLVTHLAAAAGCIAWISAEWIRFGKPSVLGIVTGMVAGLGTITPAAGYVGPAAAILIGLAGGIVCFAATMFVERVLHIDDSLDVFPVHGVGGMLGTLAAGIFAATGLGPLSGYGLAPGMSGIGAQFGVQLLGVVTVLVYTAVLTWGLLKLVDKLVGLRIGPDDEDIGLDITEHEERGYDLQSTGM